MASPEVCGKSVSCPKFSNGKRFVNVILSGARILEKLRVPTVMGIVKGFHKLENLMRIFVVQRGYGYEQKRPAGV
jgi:hypothetical protein